MAVSSLYSVSLYADSELSTEQHNMIAGLVKGTGCVEVKNRQSIDQFTERKATLKAMATLTADRQLSGDESLKLDDNTTQLSTSVTSKSSAINVNSTPVSKVYFSSDSTGYLCITI